MRNLFISKKMIEIESDRMSLCMADDMYGHNIFSEFPENISMEVLINKLLEIHSLTKHWAVWAGNHETHIHIKDIDGNWLIDKKMTIKKFFRDVDKYVYFYR